MPQLRASRPLHVGRGARALATGLGGAALSGFIGTAPSVGAVNPAPVLWEIDYGANTINSFPVTASGNVAPATVNSNSTMQSPSGSVFDAAGDMWVASWDNTSNIAEFTPK